jgi:hypothetical protein
MLQPQNIEAQGYSAVDIDSASPLKDVVAVPALGSGSHAIDRLLGVAEGEDSVLDDIRWLDRVLGDRDWDVMADEVFEALAAVR